MGRFFFPLVSLLSRSQLLFAFSVLIFSVVEEVMFWENTRVYQILLTHACYYGIQTPRGRRPLIHKTCSSILKSLRIDHKTFMHRIFFLWKLNANNLVAVVIELKWLEMYMCYNQNEVVTDSLEISIRQKQRISGVAHR